MMLNNGSYFILALSILIFSCGESADLSSVEKKVKQVNRSLTSVSNKQGEVLDRLSRVEEKIDKNQVVILKEIADLKKGQVPAKNDKSNKKQQPPKSDPNKVYDIAIGNSIVLGKKDAPITIIEWTDFQ